MQDTLINQLGIGDSDATQRNASYLAEDPEVVSQRGELMQKKTRLEEVLGKLFNFSAV